MAKKSKAQRLAESALRKASQKPTQIKGSGPPELYGSESAPKPKGSKKAPRVKKPKVQKQTEEYTTRVNQSKQKAKKPRTAYGSRGGTSTKDKAEAQLEVTKIQAEQAAQAAQPPQRLYHDNDVQQAIAEANAMEQSAARDKTATFHQFVPAKAEMLKLVDAVNKFNQAKVQAAGDSNAEHRFVDSVLPDNVDEILNGTYEEKNGKVIYHPSQIAPGSRSDMRRLIRMYESYNKESFYESKNVEAGKRINKGDMERYQYVRSHYLNTVQEQIKGVEGLVKMEEDVGKKAGWSRSDIELSSGHQMLTEYQSMLNFNAAEARDRRGFAGMFLHQYGYGTAGRLQQQNEMFRENLIKTYEQQNTSSPILRRLIESVQPNDLRDWTRQDEWVKFYYDGKSAEDYLDSPEGNLLQFMETRGYNLNQILGKDIAASALAQLEQ